MSLGFPRDKRITRGPELQRVMKEGKRIRTRSLDIRVTASPLELPGCRVGIVVPKAKHSGVDRNRLKRRLRELARQLLLPTGIAADVVLMARGGTYAATFANLEEEMRQAVNALRQEPRAGSDTR